MATDKKNIFFTMEMDDELLDCLQEQCNLGRRGDRGFKSEAYVAVAKAMTESTNNTYEFTETQIRNRVKRMKADFAVVNDLLNASGFGFDNVNKMVTAPPDVWKSWLEGHPSHKPWKKKTINHEKMAQVFGKDTATGAFASGIDDIDLDDANDEALQTDDHNIEESSGTSGTKRKRSVNADLVECMRESGKALESAFKEVAYLIADPNKKLAEDVFKELKNLQVLTAEDIDMFHEYLVSNPTKARVFLTTDDKLTWLHRRYVAIQHWSSA